MIQTVPPARFWPKSATGDPAKDRPSLAADPLKGREAPKLQPTTEGDIPWPRDPNP